LCTRRFRRVTLEQAGNDWDPELLARIHTKRRAALPAAQGQENANTATATNGDWNVAIAPKQTSRLVVKKPGIVGYFCKCHPNMKAAWSSRLNFRIENAVWIEKALSRPSSN
jgi:hypothetical protein